MRGIKANGAWVLIGVLPVTLAACASHPQAGAASPSTLAVAAPVRPAAQLGGSLGRPDGAHRAADHALKMLNAPYRFGGSNPSAGFDCSGLVQFSYRQAGLVVPRTTDQQRRASKPIRLADVRPGDLIFFDQEGKKNSHVGIYVGNGRFVHAPSSGKRVRSDELKAPYWRKHISGARRFMM